VIAFSGIASAKMSDFRLNEQAKRSAIIGALQTHRRDARIDAAGAQQRNPQIFARFSRSRG